MPVKKKSKEKPFEIEGRHFAPGTRTRFTLDLAKLYIQTPIQLAIVVLQGARPGPRLLVSAALHGDEINGIFSCGDILTTVEPEKLAGTLILVPAVNLFGVIHQIRYLPDRRDLNRSFPGSARGSLASNLAHTFLKRIVRKATHLVDLHTAAIHRNNWPQIRANLDDSETLRLARVFGSHLIIHSNERDGSLRQAASKMGIPSLLFEGGAALRHDEEAVRIGYEGVLRVMHVLGMYPPQPKTPGKKSLETRKSWWVRAEESGFFVAENGLGEKVRKGQKIGRVKLRLHPEFGEKFELDLLAPCDGVVIGLTENPMVYRGEALMHIAQISKN